MSRLMLSLVVLTAATAATAATGDQIMHARVSYTDGGAMIRGNSDTDWSYATVNTLVFQGDTLWLDTEGALEVEFSGGSFARVADGSKVEVTSLPPTGALKAWFGSLYIQRTSRSQGDFLVETPACTANIPEDSQARFDITTEGGTVITVRWGVVRVYTPHGGAVTVNEGQRIFVDPGLLPSTPVAFDRSVEDPFDSWNRERAALLATGGQIPYVTPAATQPLGVSDLSRYGEWVYVDNTTYWRPTVVVDYTPYRYGHWSYAPVYGYVWVGDYPFCYVTSHYGRWTYNNRYGWMWAYRDTWGPAWVASVSYGPNFVWAPLDPYDQPVIAGGYFSAGGLQFSYATSSWCPSDSLLYYGPGTSVYPTNPSFVNAIYADEVYIWNVNIDTHDGRGHHGGPNYDRALEERDYTPRRVIRGPDTVNPHRPQAAERVRTLEASEGRSAFETARVRQVSQTHADSQDHRASVRSVRLSERAVSDTRQALSGVTRTVRAEDPSRSNRIARPDVPSTTAGRTARSEPREQVVSRNSGLSQPTQRTSRIPSVQSDAAAQPATRAPEQNRVTAPRTERVVTSTSVIPGRTRVRTYDPDTSRAYTAPEPNSRLRTRTEETPSVPDVVNPGRTYQPTRTPSRVTDTRSQVQSVPERTPAWTSPGTRSRTPVVSPPVTTSGPTTTTQRVQETAPPSSPSVRSQRTAPRVTEPTRVSPLPDLPNPITQPARPMQPEPPVIPQRVAPTQPQVVPRAPMPEAPSQRIITSPGIDESGRSRVMSRPEATTTRRGTISPGNGPSGRAPRGGRN